MRAPAVDIVVVNWNAGSALGDCIESLALNERTFPCLGRLIIVDNGSRDGSIEALGPPSLPLTTVCNGENRGFAAACNQGAALGEAPFILFLNPDTRLPADAIKRALGAFAEEGAQRLGVVGIALSDQEGRIVPTCARAPTPALLASKSLGMPRLAPHYFPDLIVTEWPHDVSRDVDHVMGAFYLIRRSLFEELSGFDERFFVYYEDLDLSLRVRAAGWRIRFLAEPRAFHAGGGTSAKALGFRTFLSIRSRIALAYKHFSWPQATGHAVLALFVEPFARLAGAAMAGKGSEAKATLQAYGLLWGDIGRRLGQRIRSRLARAFSPPITMRLF